MDETGNAFLSSSTLFISFRRRRRRHTMRTPTKGRKKIHQGTRQDCSAVLAITIPHTSSPSWLAIHLASTSYYWMQRFVVYKHEVMKSQINPSKFLASLRRASSSRLDLWPNNKMCTTSALTFSSGRHQVYFVFRLQHNTCNTPHTSIIHNYIHHQF